ncbi:hypothetical protein D9M69_346070 [compost metagenome]
MRQVFAKVLAEWGEGGGRIAQVLDQAAIQALEDVAQLGQDVLLAGCRRAGDELGEAWRQPAEGGGAGARFGRVEAVPMFVAQGVQQGEAGTQAGKGFALIKAPGQPGGDAQVLAVPAEQRFAGGAHPWPVDAAGGVGGRGFFQFDFQLLIVTGIAYVDPGEVVLGDGVFGQRYIMSDKFIRLDHSLTRLTNDSSRKSPLNK